MADTYRGAASVQVGAQADVWEVFVSVVRRIQAELRRDGRQEESPTVWVSSTTEGVVLDRQSYDEAVSEMKRQGLQHDYAFTILGSTEADVGVYAYADGRINVEVRASSPTIAKGLAKLSGDFLRKFREVSLPTSSGPAGEAKREPFWKRARVWLGAAIASLAVLFLWPVLANVVSDLVSKLFFGEPS